MSDSEWKDEVYAQQDKSSKRHYRSTTEERLDEIESRLDTWDRRLAKWAKRQGLEE